MPKEYSESTNPVFTGNTIYFIKDVPDAVIPKYANMGDAGMDLCAAEDAVIHAGKCVVVSTGLRIKLPNGTVGMICPRSGLASKSQITVINSPGILDSQYQGVVKVALINHSGYGYEVKKGDRIAQLVVVPFISCRTEMKEGFEEKTERGEGGFGSTGQ